MDVTISLDPIDCAVCGIIFGVSADFIKRRLSDHKPFYCPSGHTNLYEESPCVPSAPAPQSAPSTGSTTTQKSASAVDGN